MTRPTALTFDEVGWRTTLQDLGRGGTERSGVPRGGAADQMAARTANVLVGNPQGAVLIESLGGAVGFVADDDILISVTGSIGGVDLAGVAVDARQPIAVPGGTRVRVACAEHAARSYIAVAGEMCAERFLRSAAPDPRMGFGQILRAGSEVLVRGAVRCVDQPEYGTALFRFDVPGAVTAADVRVVDAIGCSEADGIPGIRELIGASEYTVGMQSDHVGVRLDGPVAHPADTEEIVSHGVPVGAMEIPHSDELIVLGRYRTLTAGYPIVGFATTAGQDVMGQVRPGQRVRFRWVTRSQARAMAMDREQRLARLAAVVRSAFGARAGHKDGMGFDSPRRGTTSDDAERRTT